MRILLVAPHYPPRYSAGVELYTQRFAQWLTATGHQVSVAAVEHLARDPGPAQVGVERDARPEADVFRLTVRQATFRQTFADDDVAAWWRGFLRQHRPEVIHLHSGYLLGGPLLDAAAAERLPVVVTLHDFWFICARFTLQHPDGACCTGPTTPAKCAWCVRADRRRIRVLDEATGGRASRVAASLLSVAAFAAATGYRAAIADAVCRRARVLAALETAAAILSPSDFLARQMEAAGFPAARITVSPTGLKAAASRRVPRAAAQGLRVAYLGQVARHKGVHVAIDAVRRCADPRVRLTIHGALERDPAYVGELRQQAGGDPRVRFAGGYGPGELDAILGEADAVVVPSTWYENRPLVMLEAQAAGVAVVASRLGGMQELVRDGEDGLLFDAGSAEALCGVLSRLAADPALVSRLSSGCRPPISDDVEFAGIVKVYERIAKDGGVGRCDS